MKAFIKKRLTENQYSKAIHWGKLLTVTGGAQLLIQAIGLISGILVIRSLSTQEYALYTIANTMLGTMIMLSDGGICTGVMAQGGKIWQDPIQLGKVIATGISLKRRFAFISLTIGVITLLYLYHHHQTTLASSVIIIASLIPSFYTALSGSLLEVAPKLQQDIVPLQKIQVVNNIARVVLLGASLFIFPFAYIAILAAGIPQLWANAKLKKISHKYSDWNQRADPKIQNEIFLFVKRMLPGILYYCASSQISIWLISIFGSTKAIAQIGALGRLGMTLTIVTVIFNTLILPRFIRMGNEKKALLNRFLFIHAGLFFLGFFIVLVTGVFSSQILWVLGDKYSDLNYELILTIIGNCLSLIVGAILGMSNAKGWVLNPIISIPISVLSIAVGAFCFDLSTLTGILVLNIFVSVIQIITNLIYGLVKINNIQPVSISQ